MRAKTAEQVTTAERQMEEAVRMQKSLFAPAAAPAITDASLRAGFIDDPKLSGLSMPDADLQNAPLEYKELRAANFSGANLTNASLQGCDLRAALFAKVTLKRTTFYTADLRGADFTGADITRANFSQARLEGAKMLVAAGLDTASLQATFDSTTEWPAGFDPVAAGAVRVA